MLLELYIKNFALIDELRIEYNQGLNIITGETGSGKSIMIDALSLALGKKASKNVVRSGENKAIVEACFSVSENIVQEIVSLLGIDIEENLVILAREVSKDGRSISRINGRTITQNDLKLITPTLITIHGQNEYEQLMTSASQLQLIDGFGQEDLATLLSEYNEYFAQYLGVKKELLELNDNMDASKIERELDILDYEINEIKESKLKKNEKEEIKETLARLENAEKIQGGIHYSYELLYDENDSALNKISKVINRIESISNYLPESEQWLETLNDAYYSLEDLAQEIISNQSESDNSEAEIDRLNYRLDKINLLYRKYGKSHDEVINYLAQAEERKEKILSRDRLNQEYQEKIDQLEKQLTKLSLQITDSRKIVAKKLEEELKRELLSLNMKNVQFEIQFNAVPLSKTSADQVEFMISFNKGESLKPLSQTASGGEISRFMLAFKTVVAQTDEIESLIFDEIDTGVSGIAAQKIGEKLKEISKYRQVICITHLPQIASFANTHFVVEKTQSDVDTKTSIKMLSMDDRYQELAKMMSGTNITDNTLSTAKEMIAKNMEM